MTTRSRATSSDAERIKALLRRFIQLGTLLDDANPDSLVCAEMSKTYAALRAALKSVRNGRHARSRQR
jgi:hypothetical protein